MAWRITGGRSLATSGNRLVRRDLGKTKAIVSSYVGVLLYSALVFLGAWKIHYWQGFLYVVLAMVGTTMKSRPRADRILYHWRPRPRGPGRSRLG